MFGDIVKVTPTSKVVGDMALVMVSGGLTRADVEDPDRKRSHFRTLWWASFAASWAACRAGSPNRSPARS